MAEEEAGGNGSGPRCDRSAAHDSCMKAANVQLAAAGRAYLSVAQTAAIAIQDATDYLRSISTISSTAAGIGIAMVIAGETEKGAKVISTASELASKGVT